MDIDQIIYIQLLKTMSNSINSNADDTDQNMNTVIQFFDAPYDSITFEPTVMSWVGGSSQSITANEQITLGVTVTPTVTDPSTIAWGDGSSSVGGNWLWGANGTWG